MTAQAKIKREKIRFGPLGAMAFERSVERDYFIFPANISEYGIAVIN